MTRLDGLRLMRDFIDREIDAEVSAFAKNVRACPAVSAVCALYDVDVDAVLSGARGHDVTRARHGIAWLLHLDGWSVRDLNVALGYSNRTSAFAALKRVDSDIAMRALLAGLENAQNPSATRDFDTETCDNRDGPSRAVSATRPGPDHHSALTGRG